MYGQEILLQISICFGKKIKIAENVFVVSFCFKYIQYLFSYLNIIFFVNIGKRGYGQQAYPVGMDFVELETRKGLVVKLFLGLKRK